MNLLSLMMLMFPAAPAAAMDSTLLWQEPPVEEEVVEEEVAEEPAEEVTEQEPAEEEAELVEEVEEEDPNAEDPDSPYLAIIGGDIHTVSDGLIRKGTILCKEGRILKVGRRVKLPKGARRVDASGMQVYPGLIAVRTNGIVSGRGTNIADDFDPFGLNVDLGLAGGLTTVESGDGIAKLTRGTLEGTVLGTTGWINLNYSSTSPGSRRSVRAEFSKVRDFLRERRAWETAKAMGEEEGEEPEAKGLKSGYLELLEGKAIARFNANGLKDLLSICDLLDEYPMQSVIFGGQEAWACAGRLGRVGARLVITPRAKSWADDSLNRPSGWTIENAKILWEHGVTFSILPQQTFISTGGLAGRDLLNLPMEAAFAIRGGLPQQAALQALTLDAAKILGMDDRLGTIEVGKDADIIICDGDLFHYRTFVEWSVVNGRVAYDKAKAPYFAHIRPREVPSMDELIEEIQRAADAMEEEAGNAEGGVEIVEEEVSAEEIDAPGGN